MALLLNPHRDDFTQHRHATGARGGLHHGVNHVDVFAQDFPAKFDERLGHGSGGLFVVNRRVRDTVRDAPERRLHPIRDPRRKHVRPLDDGLIRHPDGLGSRGRCSAEKNNGFGLEHSELNHSSSYLATIVRTPLRILATMVGYRERFNEAMRLSGRTDKQIAAELGVPVQTIIKVINGKTKQMRSVNSARAAAFMKVDADWLALGKGEPHSKRVWPFEALTPEQWFAAPANLREVVEKMLATASPEPPAPIEPAKKMPPGKEQRVDQKPMFIHDLHRGKDKLIQWLPVPAEFLSAGKKR